MAEQTDEQRALKWESGCECWVSDDGEITRYRPECPVHGEAA